MKYSLIIQWYEIEYGIEVKKSKYGVYESATAALKHALEMASREGNKGMEYIISPM